MSAASTLATVASFEFLRTFKPKETLVTLALFCCGALFLAWLRSSEGTKIKAPISIVGDALELENAEHLPFRFFPLNLDLAEFDEEDLRGQIERGEHGMVVFVRSLDELEIVVHDEVPGWYPQLLSLLESARQTARLKASGIDPATALEGVPAAVQLDVRSPEGAERKEKLKLLAAACILGMMLGLFIGSAHLFTGITGEKQSHVTESVISAIPVQSWIDGKCLGVTLTTIFGLVVMAGSWAVANQLYGLFQEPLRIPLEIVDAKLFAGFLLIALLGFAMWFSFFAAIAATVDDPNTSSRSVFMFVPALMSGVGFFGLSAPDAPLYRFASMFPLTSPGVMPVRLISGHPQAWEFALAVALLVAATWAFRRLAARIFSMAMLMRGKELSWTEIWRAFRSAPSHE